MIITIIIAVKKALKSKAFFLEFVSKAIIMRTRKKKEGEGSRVMDSLCVALHT